MQEALTNADRLCEMRNDLLIERELQSYAICMNEWLSDTQGVCRKTRLCQRFWSETVTNCGDHSLCFEEGSLAGCIRQSVVIEQILAVLLGRDVWRASTSYLECNFVRKKMDFIINQVSNGCALKTENWAKFAAQSLQEMGIINPSIGAAQFWIFVSKFLKQDRYVPYVWFTFCKNVTVMQDCLSDLSTGS